MKLVKWGGMVLVILVLIGWKADLRSNKALRDAEAQINARAPWAIGPGIRLDKAKFAEKKFDIHYTITDLKASEVDIAAANTEFKKVMVKIVCANDAMRRAAKNDIVFSSVWHGSDGREITQVGVTGVDCA